MRGDEDSSCDNWKSPFVSPGVAEDTRMYPNFPDWVDKEMYAYNIIHSLRSNTKGYGGKIH